MNHLQPSRSSAPPRLTRRHAMAGLGASFAALVRPAWAAQADTPLADSSQYYTVRHPQEFDLDYTQALYGRADRMTLALRKRVPHHLNQAFGDHPRQALDLYLPPRPVSGAPVLLFIHGGGFEEGDRSHYGFVAGAYAARGVVVAISGYRLCTEGFGHPAQPEDARQAVVWLHRNARGFGADPEAIFVAGHSVGAMLAADICADRGWLQASGIAPGVLRGMAPISGGYDLTPHPDFDPLDGQTISVQYVPSREAQVQASAIRHLNDPTPRAVIAYGDGDAYERRFVRPSKAFDAALRGKGVASRLLYLKKQTHIDTVFSLADERSPVFKAVAAMVLARSSS